MKKILGFISPFDPNDKRASSGSNYKIASQLARIGYDIKWIQTKSNSRLYGCCSKLYGLLCRCRKKPNYFGRTKIGAFLESFSINKKELLKCDILFDSFSSSSLYRIKTNKPIIYQTDATFDIMLDYYYFDTPPRIRKSGIALENVAIQKSCAVVCSSDWCANAVINNYGKDKNQVFMLEYGANIDEKDIVEHRFDYSDCLEILFLGVDWVRKGGELAVEIVNWLNERGIKAKLNIVGIRSLDDAIISNPHVQYYGFLNKNNSDDYAKLVSIIKKCHLLLLPTKAECSAIAFAEASANGLPIFSHKTGGCANYVFDGENGYLLPIGSSAQDFGSLIKDCLENGSLEQMSEACKNVYRNKLNWDRWGDGMKIILEKCFVS